MNLRAISSSPTRSTTDGSDPILYRSGDAVVLDNNGNIGFRGRIDDQVKIRGFRVELGEIEVGADGLAGYCACLGCAAHGRRHRPIGRVCRGESGADLAAKQLRASLRDRLPAYMLPQRFEMVDTLPKLAVGQGQPQSAEKSAARRRRRG